MKNFLLAPVLLFAVQATVLAGDADSAWSQIEKLRRGPGMPPADAPAEAVRLARAHLALQEKTLGDFIRKFPDDPRRFEAQLEFASVQSTLGVSLSDRKRVDQSLQRLSAMEKSGQVPSRYRADAAFQRITTTMQTVNMAAAARPGETDGARNIILDSARNFAASFPEDRRAARLLAEAATLLDDQPSRKRKVLEQAETIARDEGTRLRIRDDLSRIALLGQTADIDFNTVRGGKFSLAAQRGRVVALVFWAGWSPPSVAWLAEFGNFTKELRSPGLSVATVSLDKEKSNCVKTLEALGLSDWPTACSGAGWEDTLTRRLGINALPTLFLFDREGRLRSLNARQNYAGLVRQLLSEKTEPTR